MKIFCINLIILLSVTSCHIFTKRMIYDYEFDPVKKTYMRGFRTPELAITEFSDINKNVTSIIETDIKTRLLVFKRYYPMDGHSWFRSPKLESRSSQLSEKLKISIQYYMNGKIRFQELGYDFPKEDADVFRRIRFDESSGLTIYDYVNDSSGNKMRERMKRRKEGKKELSKYTSKDYETEDYCKLPKRIEILCTFNFGEHN